MKSIIRITLVLICLGLTASIARAVDNQGAQKPVPKGKTEILLEPEFTINPARTALLIMDYENEITAMIPEEARNPMLEKAAAVLKEARKAKVTVIYIVVRFRPGYPEVNPQNRLFSGLKQSGMLVEGTSGAEIDPRVAAQPGDIIVTKRRVGAFSSTDLETVLKSHNISKLVMFGISTSGVVLSTVRAGSDMDYSLAVVSDLCADRDPEVHRVLMDKVFPWQATVVTSGELLKAMGAKVN